QHVLPAQELVPGQCVTDRERLGVTHVQVARRVREPVAEVVPLPRVVRILAGPEGVQLRPASLPLRLGLPGVITLRLVGALCRCHDVLTVLPATTVPCPQTKMPLDTRG